MQPRWLKVWREVTAFKGRTALIVFSIAIGVLAFGMMGMAQMILQRELTKAYTDTRPAEAVLTIDGFGSELLGSLDGVDQVAVVEGRYELAGKIQLDAEEATTFRIQAVPEVDTLALNQMTYTEGEREPGDGGVLLERSVTELLPELRVGDTIQVEIPTTADDGIVENRLVELRVDGLVNDLSVAPSNFYPVVYGTINFNTLAGFDVPANTYNRLYIGVEGQPLDRRVIESAVNNAVTTVEAAGFTVQSVEIPEPARHQLQSQMETSLFILSTMGVLALILSAIIIVNTMSTVITQQIRDIGILKSMGGRTSQIFVLYLSMVLIYGVLAFLVALPLGIIGAIGTSIGVSDPFNFNIGSFAPPLRIILLQAGAALVIPLIAASFPIFDGVRIPIREAISDRQAPRVGDSWFNRFISLLASRNRMVLLSIRNTFRNPARLLLTVATLTLAGAMFIAGESNRQGIYGGINALTTQRNYGIEFDLRAFYPRSELEALAEGTEGVADAESWGLVLAQPLNADGFRGSSIFVFGVPTDTYMAAPSIREGVWLGGGDDELFINQDAIDFLSDPHGVGDTLSLRLAGQTVERRIIGISGYDTLPHAFVPIDDFETMTGITGRANRLIVTVSENTPEFQSQVEAALLDKLADGGYSVTRSETMERYKVITREQIGTLVALLFSIIVMVAIVGVISLGSTMGLNVIDRTREIGVLRSLGASSLPIRSMVIIESLTITALSFIPAALFSIPLGIFINSTIGLNLFAKPLDYAFPWAGFGVWIVLMSGMAIIASFIPARRAAELSIRETLAYQG